MLRSLVGSEMCIRDRSTGAFFENMVKRALTLVARTLRTAQYKQLSVAIVLLALLIRSMLRHLRRGPTAKRLVHSTPTAHLQRILDLCPEVNKPHYLPPAWARNAWTNLGVFMAKSLALAKLRTTRLTRQRLTTPDGGVVSIDWVDDDVTRSLPETAPIVIILCTITGCGNSSAFFFKYAAEAGFRCCVFNRRGMAEPLGTAQFNVIGDVEDCKQQVAAVQDRYPGVWLGMAGVSMGSALAVNYLGQTGDATPVRAGCALCPAYDVESCFQELTNGGWVAGRVDKYVLASIKKLWLKDENGNRQRLREHNPEALQSCIEAESIDEFIRSHVPFTGCADRRQYNERFNPMAWAKQIKRPSLVLNADDDMISLKCNIREDLVDLVPGMVLIRTGYGSHLAFTEGALGDGNYMCRVSMEFLKAAHQTDYDFADNESGLAK
eukprot:TRINITY_DN13355_c0_g1_i1.p1 TRINITY_DN13355_c0_g1~~TRINITY_DN13355_c0_g1_i1.p1  ORF type:complete len:475 (-),score=103.51 TRINITY_DN13355_c0_g1_i1:248-1558(-)